DVAADEGVHLVPPVVRGVIALHGFAEPEAEMVLRRFVLRPGVPVSDEAVERAAVVLEPRVEAPNPTIRQLQVGGELRRRLPDRDRYVADPLEISFQRPAHRRAN